MALHTSSRESKREGRGEKKWGEKNGERVKRGVRCERGKRQKRKRGERKRKGEETGGWREKKGEMEKERWGRSGKEGKQR